MSFRPLKLEYELDEDGGGSNGEEFVTFRGKRYSTAQIRELFEGSLNYAMVVAKDESDEEIGTLLEIALAIGWAFVSATSDFEKIDPFVFNRNEQRTTLYFKWIGD